MLQEKGCRLSHILYPYTTHTDQPYNETTYQEPPIQLSGSECSECVTLVREMVSASEVNRQTEKVVSEPQQSLLTPPYVKRAVALLFPLLPCH